MFNLIRAINPRIRRKKKADDAADNEADNDEASDKIDLFGENPDWEPGWVKAYKINAAGQVTTSHGYFRTNENL